MYNQQVSKRNFLFLSLEGTFFRNLHGVVAWFRELHNRCGGRGYEDNISGVEQHYNVPVSVSLLFCRIGSRRLRFYSSFYLRNNSGFGLNFFINLFENAVPDCRYKKQLPVNFLPAVCNLILRTFFSKAYSAVETCIGTQFSQQNPGRIGYKLIQCIIQIF